MRRAPRWLLGVAAAWFALAGSVSGILAFVEAWTAISAGVSGCALSIDGRTVRFPVADDPLGCTQRVDLVSIVVGGLTSILLLATLAAVGFAARAFAEAFARLIRLAPRRGRRWVPLGAVAAVLAGIQPLILVLWLIDRGNLTGGPIELAVGIVPLVWSVVAAVAALITWRASPPA